MFLLLVHHKQIQIIYTKNSIQTILLCTISTIFLNLTNNNRKHKYTKRDISAFCDMYILAQLVAMNSMADYTRNKAVVSNDNTPNPNQFYLRNNGIANNTKHETYP